jgi:sirohydrochlorin cobaltochelatase
MQRCFGEKSYSIPALILLILILSVGTAFAGHARPEKKGILLVAFGSSVDSAQISFKEIDKKVKAEFPGVPVHWAFTSSIIRHKLAKTENRNIDSPSIALSKMMDEGFTDVAVQSLHTIPGEEYEGLLKTAEAFEGMPKGMKKITVGRPLLYNDSDVKKAVDALISSFPKGIRAQDSIVLMGHGTPSPANIYYPAIQYYLNLKGSNMFVGTVEGFPSLENVMDKLPSPKKGKVYLLPFMSVAGDHAHNDMAGNEDDSWKSILTKAGYDCVPVMKGTAEYPAVAELWIMHLKDAFNALSHK